MKKHLFGKTLRVRYPLLRKVPCTSNHNIGYQVDRKYFGYLLFIYLVEHLLGI